MKFITSESQPACSTSGEPSPSIPIQVEAEYHTPGIAPGGGNAFGTVHSLSTHFICFLCGMHNRTRPNVTGFHAVNDFASRLSWQSVPLVVHSPERWPHEIQLLLILGLPSFHQSLIPGRPWRDAV